MRIIALALEVIFLLLIAGAFCLCFFGPQENDW